MARRPNYGVEKRQKELKRQQKQADKAEKKRLRKEGAAGETPGDFLPDSEGAASGASGEDTDDSAG